MLNRFLITISAEDQDAANQRLQAAINQKGYDDCGILDHMHCVTTTSALGEVSANIVTALESGDKLIVAPLGAPWAAHNAPTMEDCGRITNTRRGELEEEVLA